LISGKLVFFTGTPCQIAGLKQFLGRDYDNLLTADIVCHGVGSQKYFDRFIEYLNERDGQVVELRFRDKQMAGWSCGCGSIKFRDRIHEVLHEKKFTDYRNYYYSYFMSGEIYRNSCYACPYANLKRPGDFTLGDFWGVESLELSMSTDGGCSLVFVNTVKAQGIFSQISSLICQQVDVRNAKRGNKQLIAPSALPKNREKILEQYCGMSGGQINREYYKLNKARILKLYIKALIPYRVRTLLRKMRK